MKIEVINTGSELLLGEVVNTHVAWLGKQLFGLGLRISRQTTVPDGAAIRTALLEALGRADVLIVTGGLGPTTDDLTREVVSELFSMPLREDLRVREAIETRLAARGITLRERMLRQTMVPEGARVLPNANGTAPGLYIPAREALTASTPHVFLLPGPPRELQPMFQESVMPLLEELAGDRLVTECRTYRVVGIGESEVEARIGLELTREGHLEVGYCARPNEVDFRLVGRREDLEAVEKRVLDAVGDFLVSRDGEDLEVLVVHELRRLGKTVATAESCTGGFLAHRLTNVPGASDILHSGAVTYSNDSKVRLLGVPAELVKSHGAVSEPVARAMAEGALSAFGADYALSVTGIAGPGGGTTTKPVGLVFIGLAARGQPTLVRECGFASDRQTFKQLASQAALDMLRRALLGLPQTGLIH